MTPDAFCKRLTQLESVSREEAPRREAETRRTLHFLASDAEAGKLYNDALSVTSRLVCLHKRHGWCNPCIDAVSTVGAAWRAVGLRMAELESLHTQHTKEYTQ